MPKKITTSLTNARKNIFDIADDVQHDTQYVLTEHGKPKVVIMSAKDFTSWENTISLISKGVLSEEVLEQSTQRVAFQTLEDVLEKEGFIVADKAKQTYDPTSSAESKGRKKGKKHKGRNQ